MAALGLAFVLAPRPSVATATKAPSGWTLQCPKGSHIVVHLDPPDPFEATIYAPARRRLLACADAREQRNGAVFVIRPETSAAALRMVRAGPWQANAIAWFGQLRDGKPVGEWQQIGTDGAKIGVVSLSADGTGDYVERDGQRAVRISGRLARGLRSGIWRWTDADGVERGTANYVDGKLQGESVVRLASGRPEISARWTAGQRDGLFTSWWPSGIKRWEGNYVREVRDGRWCNWNDHGQLLGCNELRLGDGDWHEWTANGELSAFGPLRADRRDGVWRQFYETGGLRNETTYAHGQVVASSSRNYDAEGRTADRPVGAIAPAPPSSALHGGSRQPYGGIQGTASGRLGRMLAAGGSASIVTLSVRAVGGVQQPMPIVASLDVVESLLARCPRGGATSGSVVQGSWFGRVQSNGMLSTVGAAPLVGSGTPAPLAWVACAEVRLRALRFARHRAGAVEIRAELRVP